MAVGQIVINYHKEKKLLNIKANGWKLGEEKLLIALLGQAVKYFESPRFRKEIINQFIKK